MSEEQDLHSVLDAILKIAKNPSEILELYYWSQEAEMPALIRAIAALPLDSRRALLTFINLSHDKNAIGVTTQGEGSITLSCRISPTTRAMGAC